MSLIQGDCQAHLIQMEENSIDSLITDPPAGISFMGKDWDSDKGGRHQWIEWMTGVMQECKRVMKPGAHGLVWAIPRTSHWTATALENAGFEIRDVVTHLFGTGFPKSFNLGNGFGTALKPASEHWILVRKPCSEDTVAKNVEKWGVGGINVDGCRIGTEQRHNSPASTNRVQTMGRPNHSGSGWNDDFPGSTVTGRFPANLVLDEEAAAMLDEQSGFSTSPGKTGRGAGGKHGKLSPIAAQGQVLCPSDSGGASRFFYVAKASKSERGQDNKHPTVKSLKLMQYLCKLITPPNGTVLDPFMGSGSTGVAAKAEGFKFIGIEREAEYFAIAKGRIA